MTTELDIRAMLQASGSSVASASFFVGPLQKSGGNYPIPVVAVLGSGGPPTQEFLGRKSYYTRESLNCYVRTRPGDYLLGAQLARDFHTKLQAVDIPSTATLFDYVRCVTQSSAPLYMGPNAVGELEWSIPFSVERKVRRP